MILFKEADALRHYLQITPNKGRLIGFVPTMGALHEGHQELVRQSHTACDCTLVSIFVNPTQFNDPLDFQKYPASLEADIRATFDNGADLLFLPSVKELYPDGTLQLERYDLGYLENILEGKFRPGHFQGVCQVMFRLLKIVEPAKLFMGQKDYQQCLVIHRLIEQFDLPVKLIVAPTVREHDGLAMSSRNRRLPWEHRDKATAIFQALRQLDQHWKEEGVLAKEQAQDILQRNGFRVDYVEVADATTLEIQQKTSGRKQVALIAAFLNDVRLIDNLILHN